jgi:hypothetical protein
MPNHLNKITVFLGLPGSGKSTMAQELVAENLQSGVRTMLWDDLNVMVNEAQGDWNSIVQPVWDNHVEHLVITEVMGYITDTQPAMLKKLQEFFPGIAQKWIFFENDLPTCKDNVARRNDGRKIDGTLKIVSKNYHGVHPVILEQCEVAYESVYHHLPELSPAIQQVSIKNILGHGNKQ